MGKFSVWHDAEEDPIWNTDSVFVVYDGEHGLTYDILSGYVLYNSQRADVVCWAYVNDLFSL